MRVKVPKVMSEPRMAEEMMDERCCGVLESVL